MNRKALDLISVALWIISYLCSCIIQEISAAFEDRPTVQVSFRVWYSCWDKKQNPAWSQFIGLLHRDKGILIDQLLMYSSYYRNINMCANDFYQVTWTDWKRTKESFSGNCNNTHSALQERIEMQWRSSETFRWQTASWSNPSSWQMTIRISYFEIRRCNKCNKLSKILRGFLHSKVHKPFVQ